MEAPLETDAMNNEDNTDRELLIRLDERLKAIESNLLHMRTNYVTQIEFRPIRLIVYGTAGIILTGVMGAIVALVLQG